MRNRVKAISDCDIEEWHFVPIGENPIDLGSTGVEPAQMESFLFDGAHWLSSKEDWPIQPEIGEVKKQKLKSCQKRNGKCLPKKKRLLQML